MGDTVREMIKMSEDTDNHYCKHNTLHHTPYLSELNYLIIIMSGADTI